MSNQRFIKGFYHEKAMLAILNVLECEAHRELASESMKSDTCNINE